MAHVSDRLYIHRGRRAFLAAALCVTAMRVSTPVRAEESAHSFRMVSRERLLREVEIVKVLRAEEQRMTDLLQAQIDKTKLALASEEAELAQLRGQISDETFQRRIKDFDGRMRRARRITQERAAALQKGFQDARASVVAALPGLMDQLRRESGATVLLNADMVLSADASVDITDRAIELFNEIAPVPQFPRIDLTLPVDQLVKPETQSEGDSQE